MSPCHHIVVGDLFTFQNTIEAINLVKCSQLHLWSEVSVEAGCPLFNNMLKLDYAMNRNHAFKVGYFWLSCFLSGADTKRFTCKSTYWLCVPLWLTCCRVSETRKECHVYVLVNARKLLCYDKPFDKKSPSGTGDMYPCSLNLLWSLEEHLVINWL